MQIWRRLTCYLLLAAAVCLLGGCTRPSSRSAEHAAAPSLSQRARISVLSHDADEAQGIAPSAYGQHDQDGRPPLRIFPSMPNGDNKPLFIHKGRVIRTQASGGTYRFWSVKTGRLLRTQPITRPYDDVSEDVKLGALLKRNGSIGNVELWDISNDRLLRTLPVRLLHLPAMNDYDLSETEVQFSHDARTCAVCYADETLALWDCHTGELKWSRHRPRWPASDEMMHIFAMLYSPDDGKFALVQKGKADYGTFYHFVSIWETASGRVNRKLPKLYGCNGISLLASGGNTFVDLSSDGWCQGNYRLNGWNIKTGKHRWKPRQEQHSTMTEQVAAAFAANGKRVAVCLYDSAYLEMDRSVDVNETSSGRNVGRYTFSGSAGDYRCTPSAALSSDGRLLAVTNHRGILTLWKVAPAPASSTKKRQSPSPQSPSSIMEQIAARK